MNAKRGSLRNNWRKLIVPVFLSLLLGSTFPALAATVVVGTCMPTKVSYDSITDAVEGAPAGSTIQVCPGVHAEQVVISKSLTLKGITVGNSGYPVIAPPPAGLVTNAYSVEGAFWGLGTPLAAQVLIQGGADVTMSDLTFDATGIGSSLCSPFTLVVGVLVQNASATLNEVSVKNQLNVCGAIGNGQGIWSQNDTASPTTVTVKDSSFVNTAQAFEADGANVTSTVTGNSFLGNPSSPYNAITVEGGNSTIDSNDISDFNYPPAGTNVGGSSFGIFLNCTPGGTLTGNVIANTQVGIYLSNGCPTTAALTNNTISNAPLVGIFGGAINGVIQGNHIRSTMTAIRFPAGESNLVENNVINDACAAYGSDPAAGTTTFTGNTVFNVVNVSLVNTTSLCP